jgi:hypothetical protein
MAQVTSKSEFAARINIYLSNLIAAWTDIPDLAAEWHELEEHDRLSFVLDWPVCDDQLQQLRHWADEGFLTLAQRVRYEELHTLIDRHRGTLEELLKD